MTPPPVSARNCLVCSAPLHGTRRERYCSRQCQQSAYRLRRNPGTEQLLKIWTRTLHEQQALLKQTVYECPQCGQRLVGERRCPECNFMCRKLGLGGCCPECDEPVLVLELLDLPQ